MSVVSTWKNDQFVLPLCDPLALRPLGQPEIFELNPLGCLCVYPNQVCRVLEELMLVESFEFYAEHTGAGDSITDTATVTGFTIGTVLRQWEYDDANWFIEIELTVGFAVATFNTLNMFVQRKGFASAAGNCLPLCEHPLGEGCPIDTSSPDGQVWSLEQLIPWEWDRNIPLVAGKILGYSLT